VLTAHLWKEWREQWVLLSAIALVLTALALGFGLLAPPRLVPADAELCFAIVAVSAGFVALAGDLVPGEQRRGQMPFLLRAPGGLRSAFVAKMLVLLVGLAALVGVGWSLGELCQWAAGGPGRRPAGTEILGHAPVAIAWIAGGLAVAAPWAFAVSCWLPRGASVLPATALTLALVVAPPILVGATYRVPVDTGEVVAAALLLFAGGLLAAWLSFVRGLRFGRRPATAFHGLAAAAVFVLPSWGWCAERVWAWYHVDPSDRGVRLDDALLGADGRTAFVTLDRRWSSPRGPFYAVAVDLASGTWRQLGSVQGRVESVGVLEGEFLTALHAPQPFFLCRRLDHYAEAVVGAELRDGRTGALLADCPDGRIPDAFRDDVAAASRSAAPFHLPNGNRAWLGHRTVVIEDAGGARETIPWPAGTRSGLAAGFGLFWLPTGGQPPREVLDLSRRRTVAAPAVGFATFVRPGAWVLRSRDGAERFDPDTGERTPLALPEGARVEAIAGDGRVIVTSGAGAFLLDPDSGAREALAVAHGEGAGEVLASIGPTDWRAFYTPARTPSGADVFALFFRERQNQRSVTFARRDGARLVACQVRSPSARLVGIFDDDHVLVIADDARLESWRFGSGKVEVLFRVGGEPSATEPSGSGAR
jgi:hypothetical protein